MNDIYNYIQHKQVDIMKDMFVQQNKDQVIQVKEPEYSEHAFNYIYQLKD